MMMTERLGKRCFITGVLAAVWAAIALAPCRAPASETVVRREGGRSTASAFTFADGWFTAPGLGRIARDDVKDWWFRPAETAAQTSVPGRATGASAADVKRLEAYRRQGLELAGKYPGTAGVIILDDGRYTLTAALHHKYRYHFVGLILNESLLNWARLELGFSEGRSRRSISLARCLTKDGRLYTLDPNEIRIGRPGGGTVYFDPNSRVMSATIPGVEVGSVVEYIYEYEAYAPADWRLFFPGFYFQSELPVRRSILTVRTPAGIPLYSWEENWDVAGGERTGLLGALQKLIRLGRRPFRRTRVKEDGIVYTSWRWEKDNVPPVVQEPLMPPNSEVTPAVHATLMKTWDHLNRITGGMQQERMVPTPEIEAKTRELTRDEPDIEARIARLYHWVQKNIRYISIKSSLSSGWSGHPAGETFRQGYGDCTDKAILFCTMLHLIGIEAEPVVLRTNDAGVFLPRLPVLACNHCITELRVNGKRMYLDCTTQDHRYPSLRADDHGVLAINFIRGERRIIPIPPGRLGLGKVARDRMTLSPDGTLSVRSRNRYAGMYEARLRTGWKRVPDALRKQVMQQYLNGIAPGARLRDFQMPDPQDLSKPFRLEYTYELPAYLVRAGSLRIFQVPERERKFPEVALERRRYDIVYRTSEARERRAEISLPPDLKVVDLPPDVDIRGPHVRYRESFRITKGKLVFKSLYERSGRRIGLRKYSAYRRALQRIEVATHKPVYLEGVQNSPSAARESGLQSSRAR
ncbi:MAG: DUF3857 and transglutaminase domain-containing protein [Kiritimatiellaeota bacterium]|nr:DUF3857 and transglutaminase domain-containing protein [Kiritimatiellota bacterium]